MQEFKNFYFENYEFDLKTFVAKFYYSFDKKEIFVEEINFECEDFAKRKNLNFKIIENLLFHLFISLWISYYKLFPKSKIILEKWNFDEEQIKFWKKFYLNWLWEFLYVNKLEPKIIFTLSPALNSMTHKGLKSFLSINEKGTIKKEKNQVDNVDKIKKWVVYWNIWEKFLVPIWWGKDSIVSIELLRQAWKNFDTFVFWKMDKIKRNCIKISGKKNLFVSRKLSKNLFELNKKGYYNWHVPITGIITFVLEVVAYLYDYKYLVLSNEKSANFWNTVYRWIKINHQYSKSLEFEKDLKDYVWKYMNSNVKYFSLLRWMYEYKIAELFAKLWKKYFKVFSSCNGNFKILNPPIPNPFPPREKGDNKYEIIKKENKIWCNDCSKCAFVYSILSSFLSRQELSTIFGEDLYNKKSLVDIFEELAGISWHKPLECVGESSEIIVSNYKYLKNLKSENLKIPEYLKIFEEKVIWKIYKQMRRKCEEKKIEGNLEKYFENLEKELLKVSDNDLIPEEVKREVLGNI